MHQKLKKILQLIIAYSLQSAVCSLVSASVVTTPAITVKAALSENRILAGEMAELDVTVSGTQDATLPKELAVEGLKIRLSGQSSQVQMVNYSISSSVTYSYIVMPLKSGTFTIPAIPVRAAGNMFQTTPLQLTVVGSAANSSPASSATALLNGVPISRTPPAPAPSRKNNNNQPPDPDQLTFGELLVSKKKCYVGEMVPTEIRFYVDAHYNAQPRSGVDLSEEGLIVERLTKPKADVVQRNGRTYNFITLQTLISAVKPGIIEMTPATLDLVIQMPGAFPPGTPDVIAQMMRRAGSMGETKEVKITTNKCTLEVLPLPQEGRPDGFSGAVGEFNLTATASPKKPLPGDPVTLSLRLEGKGNFKALQPPQLTETEGWRVYPSNDHFEPSDNIGWSGVKSFETTMIAQKTVEATPGALFSYFDPNTAKYNTLTAKPIPLERAAQAALTAAPTPDPTTSTVPASTPSAKKSESSDQALDYFSTHSWESPFYRRDFLMAWGGLLGATLLFSTLLGFLYRRRVLRLRNQEKLLLEKMWAELQSSNLEARIFYNKAGEYVELLLKRDPSKNTPALESILRRRDEINYGAREVVLKDSERQKILAALSGKE